MTRDLAFTIIRNFNDGEKVSQSMLVKAAEYLQLDSNLLLKEAHFKSAATKKIKELSKTNGKLTEEELKHFSTAAGCTKDHIRKVAQLSDTSPEDVLFTYFRQTGYVPNEKYAQDETNIDDVTLQQDPAMLDKFQIRPHSLTSQDPFGNPLVQPSPQSIPQVPSMQGGNLGQLKENYDNKDQIEQEQLELANQQMLAQEGQQPGSHSKEEIENALMQADSMGKAQFIMPGGTEDQLQRLSQEIDKVEQLAGIPIKDPAQLKKVVSEIEKADRKAIDEAIKTISESNAGAATGGSGYGPLPPPANSAPQENQSTDVDMQKLATKDDFFYEYAKSLAEKLKRGQKEFKNTNFSKPNIDHPHLKKTIEDVMKNYNKQDKILKGVELGLLAGVIGYTGKMVYDEYNQKNKMQKLASILRKIKF